MESIIRTITKRFNNDELVEYLINGKIQSKETIDNDNFFDSMTEEKTDEDGRVVSFIDESSGNLIRVAYVKRPVFVVNKSYNKEIIEIYSTCKAS